MKKTLCIRQSVRLSICPSIHPSRCPLGTGSLVFSKFWHCVRSQHEVVRDKARFLLNIFSHAEMGNMGQKIGQK